MTEETTARTRSGASIRPTYRPPAAPAGPDAGTLVLRDGSRRPIARALPEDADRLLAFLNGLPAPDRQGLLRSLQLEPDGLPSFLEHVGETGIGEAFFVERGADDERVLAFGAYRRVDGDAALGLAVAPDVRGAGVGTLLLERVAVLAAAVGYETLIGTPVRDTAAIGQLLRTAGVEPAEPIEAGETFRVSTRSTDLRKAMDRVAARVFTAASLRPLFYPRSVAVIGASRSPGGIGRRILDALIHAGFNGPVYPVNPKASFVSSIRCYPSAEAIEEPVDLAVVAVPAEIVPAAVDDCARAGVRALVVITAGYAETGEEGRARQVALLDQIRTYGMRMVGPNCLGLMHAHPDVRLNASFAPEMAPPGRVALCSQSGALGIAIIALARRLGLGLSSFVSVGNKADVSANDLLEFWEQDSMTRVILLYLESFGDPRRFARLARRVGRSKPIVVVKAGRTEAGGRAASSHTAALAAAETAVEALFRQTGIIRADTLVEMFGVARALSTQPLPSGRRVAVLTNAGGPGILCVDALGAAGLDVGQLSPGIQVKLRKFLPAAASTQNPVDMIASANPETYRRAVGVLMAEEEVDALVVIYTPVGMYGISEIGDAVAAGVSTAGDRGAAKPILAAIVGEETETYRLTVTDEREIPTYQFPEEIGRILGKMADYADWRRSDPGVFTEFGDQDLDAARRTCRSALDERGDGWLSVREARTVLEAAGLRVAEGGVAASAGEAAGIADEIGYPVAVKLASVAIVHKTEIGAVKLGLQDDDAVREAFQAIESDLEARGQRDAMQGVLVQPMLQGTAEVMVGVQQDPVFGPLIAFGLGGIHVEILRDVAFRVAPLTDHDAAGMVRQIRGYRLLEGYRGHPAADVAALEATLQRVSRLVEAVPEITEVDLNPIFALEPGDGYRIVDARIKVESGARE